MAPNHDKGPDADEYRLILTPTVNADKRAGKSSGLLSVCASQNPVQSLMMVLLSEKPERNTAQGMAQILQRSGDQGHAQVQQ